MCPSDQAPQSGVWEPVAFAAPSTLDWGGRCHGYHVRYSLSLPAGGIVGLGCDTWHFGILNTTAPLSFVPVIRLPRLSELGDYCLSGSLWELKRTCWSACSSTCTFTWIHLIHLQGCLVQWDQQAARDIILVFWGFILRGKSKKQFQCFPLQNYASLGSFDLWPKPDQRAFFLRILSFSASWARHFMSTPRTLNLARLKEKPEILWGEGPYPRSLGELVQSQEHNPDLLLPVPHNLHPIEGCDSPAHHLQSPTPPGPWGALTKMVGMTLTLVLPGLSNCLKLDFGRANIPVI